MIKKSLRAAKKDKSPSETIYSRSQETLFRESSDGQLSVVHLESPQDIYKIDGWAKNLFLMLDGKKDVLSISNWIVKQSGLPARAVEKGVRENIKNFLKLGWIKKSKNSR